VRAVKVGLALGSGAARGFAHVGVIKALEAHGIVADIIVGTSAGSFAGALYAGGISGTELERVALQFEETDIVDWSLPMRGILKGDALQNFINQHVGQRRIESLPRKLGIVVTDLHSGEMVVFERGNVGMAVRASSSVPGVFRPVEISGREYVDGGLVSPVPAQAARRMGADVVIAVDISRNPAAQEVNGTFDVLLQSFNIMEKVIAERDLALADVVLRPNVGSRSSTDFRARVGSIQEGEKAVVAATRAIDVAMAAARTRLEAARDAAWAASAPSAPSSPAEGAAAAPAER
jgi:NTE family protein